MVRASLRNLGILAWALTALVNTTQAQPEPELVTLTAEDGVRTVSSWYPRQDNGPVVVLLHNTGTSSANFRPLITPLYTAGFQILAMDLRGHGRSRDLAPEVYEAMVGRETRAYLDMRYDVAAALAWLQDDKGFEAERISFVGGQYGSTLAIQAMAENPKLGATVALSPARTYFGVDILEFIDDYGPRPLYLILPKQLQTGGASAIQDAMADNPDFSMKIFPRADLHGVDLLGTTWEVEKYIILFLRDVYQLGSS